MRKIAVFLAITFLFGGVWWWRHYRQHGEPTSIAASVNVVDDSQGPRPMDIALIQAAFGADEPRVAELLKSGASPGARYGEGGFKYFSSFGAEDWTALIALANSNTTGDRVPIARLLLDAGADINAADGYGATALAESCYGRGESLALFLLERGANPNTRTGVYIDGAGDITPVHRAVENPRILRSLIQHHAEVNVVDSDGRSPLSLAKREKDTESAHILLEAGADDTIALRQGKDSRYSQPIRMIEMLLPAQYPMNGLQSVIEYFKARPEVLAAWILGSKNATGDIDEYDIYLRHAAKDPEKLKDSVAALCDGKGAKFNVLLLDQSRWANVRLMRSGVPFYAAPGYKVPTANK